jgi:hypothetical protein
MPIATTGTEPLADRWLATILDGVRGDTTAIELTGTDVAEAVSERRSDLTPRLTRFGREMGSDGWMLSEVAAWITTLADLAGDVGDPLRTFDAGVALTEGWADGYLYGAQTANCTDGLTGLALLPVLRMRLGQVYDQFAGLGIPARQVFCTAVIDVDLGDRPPLERDAAMVVVGDQVARVYSGGETAAVWGGRVLVLTSRTEATHETFRGLLVSLQGFPLLAGGRVMGWIEDLPPSTDDLDRYLGDLVS